MNHAILAILLFIAVVLLFYFDCKLTKQLFYNNPVGKTCKVYDQNGFVGFGTVKRERFNNQFEVKLDSGKKTLKHLSKIKPLYFDY